jgi:hypothetical protein
MKRSTIASVFTILGVAILLTADGPSLAQAQVQELLPPPGASGGRVGPRISTRPLPEQSTGRPIIAADDGLIVGENLIVAMGAKSDRLWAFSRERGSWHRQTIPEDRLYGPIVPQVSSNLVVFQMGKKLYAFSAPRGEWHTHDLEHHVQAAINVGPDMAWCRVGPRVYAFSAKNGGWSSIDVFRD